MLLGIALRGALAFILATVWEVVRLLNGADWSWGAIGWRLAMLTVALSLSAWAAMHRKRWLLSLILALSLTVAACWLDLGRPSTPVALFAETGLYTVLLCVESAFAAQSEEKSGCLAQLEYGVGFLLLAAVGGVIPTVLAQVEAQFAEEEFFVAVQAAFLFLFSGLLLVAQVVARRLRFAIEPEWPRLRPLWGVIIFVVGGFGFLWWSVKAYQASFYSPTAPGYDGISAETPFICASLPIAPGTADGQQVFNLIQQAIESNPHKNVPEFGMLALVTGEQRWADAFHHAILEEAEAGRFTEPANSVKYGQRLAARRAYYLSRVRDAFPQLFSDEELATLSNWFAAINRRAMTVEWVDWLYGLAFSAWPEGPYENQENGAGLLAVLESAGLSDSTLSSSNRDYLSRNARGWIERFRNTDDAYLYQPEWIDSALFQELYRGTASDPEEYERHRQLAFEWLLLQTLPGGAPLTYNRPGTLSVANTLYLGALVLNDPRYVWVANASLNDLATRDGFLYAQPGLERAVEFEGHAPTQGSCLLFSPTGLPTQVGPLAPDKIVFRDGWGEDATYLLLNLRFTGWHRYKDTNGVVLLYKNGPVVVEDSAAEPFGWLPVGRSLFRDKRIPRENLNGLQVRRSGLSQVVYLLTGLNGPWAQDPPHDARVDGFYTLGLLDASRTTIADWRGWEHQRTIYFIHQGPVIIVDDARQADSDQSALTWHLDGSGEPAENGLWLRRDDESIRVALASDSWPNTTLRDPNGGAPNAVWEMTYLSPESGQLDLVTAFLMNGWEEADYDVQKIGKAAEPIGQFVRISTGNEEVLLLHNAMRQTRDQASLASITASGLTTDGLGLLVMADGLDHPSHVCAVGGSRATLPAVAEPRDLRLYGLQEALQRGQDWDWESGLLTLWLSSGHALCVDLDY